MGAGVLILLMTSHHMVIILDQCLITPELTLGRHNSYPHCLQSVVCARLYRLLIRKMLMAVAE